MPKSSGAGACAPAGTSVLLLQRLAPFQSENAHPRYRRQIMCRRQTVSPDEETRRILSTGEWCQRILATGVQRRKPFLATGVQRKEF